MWKFLTNSWVFPTFNSQQICILHKHWQLNFFNSNLNFAWQTWRRCPTWTRPRRASTATFRRPSSPDRSRCRPISSHFSSQKISVIREAPQIEVNYVFKCIVFKQSFTILRSMACFKLQCFVYLNLIFI